MADLINLKLLRIVDLEYIKEGVFFLLYIGLSVNEKKTEIYEDKF